MIVVKQASSDPGIFINPYVVRPRKEGRDSVPDPPSRVDHRPAIHRGCCGAVRVRRARHGAGRAAGGAVRVSFREAFPPAGRVFCTAGPCLLNHPVGSDRRGRGSRAASTSRSSPGVSPQWAHAHRDRDPRRARGVPLLGHQARGAVLITSSRFGKTLAIARAHHRRVHGLADRFGRVASDRSSPPRLHGPGGLVSALFAGLVPAMFAYGRLAERQPSWSRRCANPRAANLPRRDPCSASPS